MTLGGSQTLQTILNGVACIVDTCNDIRELYTDSYLTGLDAYLGKTTEKFLPYSEYKTLHFDFFGEHHCNM